MNNAPNPTPRHKAAFGDLARIATLAPDLRRKMMATIASKTEQEQIEIFKIKTEIAYNIKTNKREQIKNFMRCERIELESTTIA